MQPTTTTTTTTTVSLRALASAPRGYLFTSSRPSLRTLRTSAALRSDSRPPSSPSPPFPFGGPSPPKLPKEDQEIFESLQRASTGAFSTPRRTPPPRINQSPHSAPAEAADAQGTVQARVEKLQAQQQQANTGEKDDARNSNSNSMSQFKEQYERVIEARGRGEELHPNVVRGARPEFEGDVNPKTGEVGGPKNEPLRWGASGEWSYNGRTTDF